MGFHSPEDGHADIPPPLGVGFRQDQSGGVRQVLETGLALIRERLGSLQPSGEALTRLISRDEALTSANHLDDFVDSVFEEQLPASMVADMAAANKKLDEDNLDALRRWRQLNLENIALLLEVSAMVRNSTNHATDDYAAFCSACAELERSLAASLVSTDRP